MHKIGISLLAIFVVLTAAAFPADAQTGAQTVFELEGGIDNPVTIPADVIAVLKSDRRVDACFKTEGAGTDESAWFEAAEFELNDDQRVDLIIKPKHACLFGANQGPFWIFQNAADGYQKIFDASGLRLAVLPRKGNNFNVIRISRTAGMKAATTEYRFSHGKYHSAR